MRIVLLTMGAAVLIANHAGLFSPNAGHSAGSVDDVVSVKCGHMDFDDRNDCVERYHAAFDASDLEPVLVLRQHCTRWSNPWEERVDEPPSTCVEMFGGWIDS